MMGGIMQIMYYIYVHYSSNKLNKAASLTNPSREKYLIVMKYNGES